MAESEYFKKGAERAQEGADSPLGSWDSWGADERERDAAQRGWEAARASQMLADSINSGQSQNTVTSSSDYSDVYMSSSNASTAYPGSTSIGPSTTSTTILYISSTLVFIGCIYAFMHITTWSLLWWACAIVALLALPGTLMTVFFSFVTLIILFLVGVAVLLVISAIKYFSGHLA